MSVETPRISVVVADDHPIMLLALAGALRGDARFEVVAQAADGRDALTAIREHAPHVAVLDEDMPKLTGSAVAAIARTEDIATRS